MGSRAKPSEALSTPNSGDSRPFSFANLTSRLFRHSRGRLPDSTYRWFCVEAEDFRPPNPPKESNLSQLSPHKANSRLPPQKAFLVTIPGGVALPLYNYKSYSVKAQKDKPLSSVHPQKQPGSSIVWRIYPELSPPHPPPISTNRRQNI